jgi:hypothetical protein
MNDWRLLDQEKYLRGVGLAKKLYRPYRAEWDHDHCEFCGAKFSARPGDLHVGYTTDDGYRWICEPCFNDFNSMFQWKVEPGQDA